MFTEIVCRLKSCSVLLMRPFAPSRQEVPDLGSRGIFVLAGGSLDLHGTGGAGWTRLARWDQGSLYFPLKGPGGSAQQLLLPDGGGAQGRPPPQPGGPGKAAICIDLNFLGISHI